MAAQINPNGPTWAPRDPARPPRTGWSVPATHLIRHNAPRLSSIRLAGPPAPHLKPRHAIMIGGVLLLQSS